MFCLRNLIASTVLLSSLSSLAVAQAPMYQPYGSWRGRVRYVDYQNGIRTRAVWKNGLTPTGGQVLTQLITTAGTVATDPNFLNTVSGVAGLKKGAELNPQVTSLNQGLADKNVAMLDELNKVRDLVKLAPTPMFDRTAPTPAPISTTAGNVTTPQDIKDQKPIVDDAREKLGAQVRTALKIFPRVADAPQPNQAAVTAVLALQQLTVLTDMQLVDPAKKLEELPADGAPGAAAFGPTVEKMRDSIQELIKDLEELKRRCDRLDPSTNPTTKAERDRLNQKADQYLKELRAVKL